MAEKKETQTPPNNSSCENQASLLEKLKIQAKGYWPERILSEIEYAMKLSLVADKGRKHEIMGLAAEALSLLETDYGRNGAITKRAARAAEEVLLPLSPEAKKYTLLLISHAHIDMNWMWGYAETVAVTIDTFRTILDMMKEYPGFTFAQSQASVYRIIEQYAPELLREVRAKIREGRWEVTASQWVEGDKNMASAESLARHLLYTRRYLSRLFNLAEDYFCIDYEPDTFGHNANMPEILSGGGVKYYYHCRALDSADLIYRWRSPSGSEVIVNREAFWYNGIVSPDYAFSVPEICEKYGITKALRVYGVGDHGGGPTRRDIERIIEYSQWPVFPQVRFGTYHEYFKQLEEIKESLPVIQKEINFVFTGCYTTQTRIKLANKIGENRMTDAGMYNIMAGQLTGGGAVGIARRSGGREGMFEGWENVLFNQFHDILPGSGVTETREYTMGIFQKTLAFANAVSRAAMQRIAANIDTSGLPGEMDKAGRNPETSSLSEGAGVGYAIADYGLPQAERGRGKNRILHFFNPSGHDFEGIYEITIWDWPGDQGRFRVYDSSGERAEHNLLRGFNENYWGHKMLKANVRIKVPAAGYSTYTVREDEPVNASAYPPHKENIERPFGYVLENSRIKVEFDTVTLVIKSMIDKASGRELIDGKNGGVGGSGGSGAGFALVNEQNQGMTAWKIGRYAAVESAHRQVSVKSSNTNPNALRQYVAFTVKCGRDSKLEITCSLDKDSTKLDVGVKCDWLETGGEFIPQLQYRLPLAYKADKAKYSIPMGMIERPAMFMDVPACGMAVALDAAADSGSVKAADPAEKAAVNVMPVCAGLLAQAKYGFRLNENTLSVTLIHSSVNPDKYPELGEHKINFSILVAEDISNAALLAIQEAYDHPAAFISGTVHQGALPLDCRALILDTRNAMLSAVKFTEDGPEDALIIRLCEVGGKENEKCSITFRKKPLRAYFTDILERQAYNCGKIEIDGCDITFSIGSYRMTNIKVEF